MVVAGAKAGEGDGSDDPTGGGDGDGEAAAYGSVETLGEGVTLGDGLSEGFQAEADGVGAAMEAGDDVGFAAGPAGVVGRGAGQGGIEERLLGGSEAADVDDKGVFASDGEVAQERSKGPGGGGVEVRKGEGGFLFEDAGGVLLGGGKHRDRVQGFRA